MRVEESAVAAVPASLTACNGSLLSVYLSILPYWSAGVQIWGLEIRGEGRGSKVDD